MNSLKWLQRKYPNSFEELNAYFDRNEIKNFKKSTMKIGRLTKDVVWCQKYKKGSIIQFRRSNPVNVKLVTQKVVITHLILPKMILSKWCLSLAANTELTSV